MYTITPATQLLLRSTLPRSSRLRESTASSAGAPFSPAWMEITPWKAESSLHGTWQVSVPVSVPSDAGASVFLVISTACFSLRFVSPSRLST